MNTALKNLHHHPNAYSWPQENHANLLPAESAIAELRVQINVLEQQVVQLYQIIHSRLYSD